MRNRVELRRKFGSGARVFALGCLLFAGFSVAWAYDTPAPRSARLSYLQGSVTVVRTDNSGSDTAQLNMPLTEGRRVMTGDDGQAEVEFEDGSLVRLTPNTSLNLDHLSVESGGNFQTQLSLGHGLVYAELRAASKYQYQLNVDGALVSPVENATIRINLDEPPAVISILMGRAHVENAGSQDSAGYRTDVRGGETLTADPFDTSRYFLSQQIAPDSWDNWNEERDQAAADEAARQTAARDNLEGDHGYGWSDLDANGSWYNVPGQGPIWQPEAAMDANFDPYGYGSWVWYPGSGYVWASGYSWGWTPFRCGNWSFWNGFGWGWAPAGNCGLGWGFGSGIFVINIVRPPAIYHYPSVPVPVHRPGVTHPIIVVHPGGGPNTPNTPIAGPRTIAGHTVQPLQPVVNTYTSRGGSAVGASLLRDFPMDRNNHQPVIGRVGDNGSAPGSTAGIAPVTRPETPTVSARPRRPPPPSVQDQDHPAQRSVQPARSYAYGEMSRPAGEVSHPAPQNPVARPIYPSSPPIPRSAPPPPPPPRPSSPPASATPRATPLR